MALQTSLFGTKKLMFNEPFTHYINAILHYPPRPPLRHSPPPLPCFIPFFQEDSI